jgi:hypothetical protein
MNHKPSNAHVVLQKYENIIKYQVKMIHILKSIIKAQRLHLLEDRDLFTVIEAELDAFIVQANE